MNGHSKVMEYYRTHGETAEVSYPLGSAMWCRLEPFGREGMKLMGFRLPIKRLLPKDWTCEVRAVHYSELWLRYYAAMRHYECHGCTVLASDWANHMSDQINPLVRDLELDLELLSAHGLMASKLKIKRKKPKVVEYAY